MPGRRLPVPIAIPVGGVDRKRSDRDGFRKGIGKEAGMPIRHLRLLGGQAVYLFRIEPKEAPGLGTRSMPRAALPSDSRRKLRNGNNGFPRIGDFHPVAGVFTRASRQVLARGIKLPKNRAHRR